MPPIASVKYSSICGPTPSSARGGGWGRACTHCYQGKGFSRQFTDGTNGLGASHSRKVEILLVVGTKAGAARYCWNCGFRRHVISKRGVARLARDADHAWSGQGGVPGERLSPGPLCTSPQHQPGANLGARSPTRGNGDAIRTSPRECQRRARRRTPRARCRAQSRCP